MDQDNLAPAGEDQVGRPGQVAAAQAEALAGGVNQAADGELEAGVLAANAGHAFGASMDGRWSAMSPSTSGHAMQP